MRISILGSVMLGFAVLISGVSSAVARNATQLEEHSNYSGCYCQFGYGGSCTDSVECTSEGGRCIRACVVPR
jgi:hypothetical protein